eukprot:gb/GECG01011061.1/.p1 GENE.gb/GECG01011061.1/~~gb/GECG01011061.1/.p1  ORF type:complete len:248 (+),score=14.86 gb/GECG01011061.1/:1-744(+)
MSEIVQGIYIGGDAEASNFTWLKEHDIRYILNVTPGKTESPSGGVPNYFESRGLFTYKRCPLYDNGTNDIRSVLTESIGFIKQGIHYGNVLVHCVQGVSRSVSVVVAYLMMVEGMSSKRARRYIRKKRPAAQPNKYFLDQLKEFEKTLDVGDRRVPSKKRAAGTSTGSSGRSKATRRSGKQHMSELHQSRSGYTVVVHVCREGHDWTDIATFHEKNDGQGRPFGTFLRRRFGRRCDCHWPSFATPSS